MMRPLTQDELASGQQIWRQVRNAIQTLCSKYNAKDTTRMMLSQQLTDAKVKDPAGLGADMLLESATQLIKPMPV